LRAEPVVGAFVLALAACAAACGDRSPAHRDQNEYVDDVVAFTGAKEAEVRERIKQGAVPLKLEWESWEKEGPMTPDRIKVFYKQTANYIYELGHWHLWDSKKRASDLALVEDMRTKIKPKNILDFGGGVGLNALPLARAGFDVTLADLDSTTLRFAVSRAERHGVRMKVWKSDVEPAPPDPTYDAILVLDVLEHLPKDELDTVVDKLIKLKHPGTEIILSAPFGRTATHPMHLDADAHTQEQIRRLQTELPRA
jgi:2-polyprenyl-3-methyl-5-hydroxy-6-metoxy-1,4-benzoquinol methylase